jgi:hypothetical protein
MADDLRTLATFTTFTEAAMARNRLEAVGIPSVIADGQTVTMDYLLGNAIGWIKLQVKEIDLERAEAVLAEREESLSKEEEEELARQAEEAEEAEGLDDELDEEDTGAKRVDGVDVGRPAVERYVDLAYRASIIGVFLLMCFPFIHAYSFILLLRVVRHTPEFSQRGKRRFYVAFFIDLAALVGLLSIVGYIALAVLAGHA